MAFDWSKYLELAKYLADNSKQISDEEACLRTSVSRAYYAAFSVTKQYIQKTDGNEFKGGDAHLKVRQHLINSGNATKRKIAKQLNDIHFNRKKADYDDEISRESPRSLAFKTGLVQNRVTLSETDQGNLKESLPH